MRMLDERRVNLDGFAAEEAIAMDDIAFARMVVDPSVAHQELARLAAGMTPAKLARAVAMLRPAEVMLALTKMRVRRTPSIQAHVTSRLDDPLLLTGARRRPWSSGSASRRPPSPRPTSPVRRPLPTAAKPSPNRAWST